MIQDIVYSCIQEHVVIERHEPDRRFRGPLPSEDVIQEIQVVRKSLRICEPVAYGVLDECVQVEAKCHQLPPNLRRSRGLLRDPRELGFEGRRVVAIHCSAKERDDRAAHLAFACERIEVPPDQVFRKRRR